MLKKQYIGRIAAAAIAVFSLLILPVFMAAQPAQAAEDPNPRNIIAGPDGAMWFTEQGSDKIGRITTSGVVTEYPVLTAGAAPYDLTTGPDGAIWFTQDNVNQIGRMTLDGTVTEFPAPADPFNNLAHPAGITLGPDNALWFVEKARGAVVRMETDGSTTTYQVSDSNSGFEDITSGHDLSLWFTETNAHKIGKITLDGTVTEYDLPGNVFPFGIVRGPDDSMWFTAHVPGSSHQLGRIQPDGTITTFPLPVTDSFPMNLTVGADGAFWFAQYNTSTIGRMTMAGEITEFPVTPDSCPSGIAAGHDDALWFTEFCGNRIGRMTTSGALTEYSLLPEPVTVTLNAAADTYVRSGQANQNEGAGQFIKVQSTGNNRSLVRFDQSGVEAAIGDGALLSAKLRFTITENGNNWGLTGRTIDLHRLLTDWAEGNGTAISRGNGLGATWNCAIDSEIANLAKNCSGATEWEMGQPNNPSVHPWAEAASATQTITNGQGGVVEFDVTSDITNFLNGTTTNNGWLLKRTNENQTGSVSFGSRESITAPQLVITYQP